jgi:hypothetical protein
MHSVIVEKKESSMNSRNDPARIEREMDMLIRCSQCGRIKHYSSFREMKKEGNQPVFNLYEPDKPAYKDATGTIVGFACEDCRRRITDEGRSHYAQDKQILVYNCVPFYVTPSGHLMHIRLGCNFVFLQLEGFLNSDGNPAVITAFGCVLCSQIIQRAKCVRLINPFEELDDLSLALSDEIVRREALDFNEERDADDIEDGTYLEAQCADDFEDGSAMR